MEDQLVRGYIFGFFPVEFNLTDDSMRAEIEHWTYRWLGWTLYFFKDDQGNILSPTVTIYHSDPGVIQDCMRIAQWTAEGK